jgi:ABC-type branched-subunit amino acid transport system substrate-binding protein
LTAAGLNLLEISWGCTSPKLSDKTRYPTFARLVGSHDFVAFSIARLAVVYSWRKVAIVAANTAYIWSSSAEAAEAKLLQQNVLVSMYYFGEKTDKTQMMTQAKKSGAVAFFFFSYNPDLRRSMLIASDLGMVGTGSAFIHADQLPLHGYKAESGEEDGYRDEEARVAMYGMLYLSPAPVSRSLSYSAFEAKWKERYSKEYGVEAPEGNVYKVPMYETVYLYAHAVGEAVKNGVDPRNGEEMMRIFQKLSFELLGRTVQLNAQAERNTDWSLYNWLAEQAVKIADYSFQSDEFSFSSQPIVWSGNTTTPPVGVDLQLGFIIPRSGWNVFQDISLSAVMAVDEVCSV